MLTMTPTAATALTRARSDKGAPDNYAVRFFASSGATAQKAQLRFLFVESPEPDDRVTQEGGLKAYVAPEVDQLEGGDVIVDVEPVGEESTLVLRRS